MALKIRLVDAHVLDRNERIAPHELHDAVDHHKGITVRQRVENTPDIEGRLVGHDHCRTRLFLRPLFTFLQLGGERLGQFGVDRMTGARGDNVRLQRHAQQRDVTDDIQNLVAHELILKAQAFLRNDLIALDHDRAIERAAFDLAELEQLLDVLVNRERPRGRDLRHVGIRIDEQRQMLRVNAPIIGRGAGDPEIIRRQRDDGRLTFRHRDGGIQREVFAIRGLLHGLPLHDQIDKGFGRTIEDGRLRGVHFNNGVVDAAAAQRTQDVFDRLDFRVAHLNGGRADEIGDEIDARAQLRRPAEIDPPKDETMVNGRRFQRQSHRIAGVQ